MARRRSSSAVTSRPYAATPAPRFLPWSELRRWSRRSPATVRDLSPAAVAAGDGGRFGAAGGAELAEDVGDVDAHRLGADEELPADLAVAPSVGDQRQDLPLARGEPLPGRPWRRARARSRTRAARRGARRRRARCAASRARSPCSRAAVVSPRSRRIPAYVVRARASSGTLPNSANASTVAAHAAISSSRSGASTPPTQRARRCSAASRSAQARPSGPHAVLLSTKRSTTMSPSARSTAGPLEQADPFRRAGRRQRAGDGAEGLCGQPDPAGEVLGPDPGQHRHHVVVGADRGARVARVAGRLDLDAGGEDRDATLVGPDLAEPAELTAHVGAASGQDRQPGRLDDRRAGSADRPRRR